MKRLLPILILLQFSVLYSTAQDPRGPNPGRKVSFYPNPATSFITFDIPQDNFQKGSVITVFNFLGKKMSETQATNSRTVLSLTDFNRGTYIYHLVDRTGKVIDTGKFQVSK